MNGKILDCAIEIQILMCFEANDDWKVMFD